ncbi:hypothetical protein D8796_11150 [Streptococcus cristatus]|uniref:Uncharacterized protein n=1 Tax=Streptococcus cristatus TaxID=45634 RepID=A0A428GPG5_STRCR|nr:hypothetical protein D8795_11090 [Streptococcus cristatus]RSJ76638.1 hypothetical protein D8796_11150 [Streptococcus cristatus]RSJ83204.1 hypothetical protein D8793_11175 [Streptococcus cristatus]RSJ83219.1 hypothetical protein D8794_10855 [Streptococcus cristatus]
MEDAVLKKFIKFRLKEEKRKKKNGIIQELLIEFSFDILLKIVEITRSPNLEQVKTMLEEAFTEKYWGNTILYRDQV